MDGHPAGIAARMKIHAETGYLVEAIHAQAVIRQNPQPAFLNLEWIIENIR